MTATNNWGWSEDGEYIDNTNPGDYIPDLTEQEEIDAYYAAEEERYRQQFGAAGTSSSFIEPDWDTIDDTKGDYSRLIATETSTAATQPELPNFKVIPKKQTTTAATFYQPVLRKGLKKETPDLFEIFRDLNNCDVIYISMFRRGLEFLMESEEYKAYPLPTQHWIELTLTMLVAYDTVNVEEYEASKAKG